ncbi:hypothetical protein FNV43_RR27342 [Rhamnella rubrinervis]|uniref:Uncharacterized protein n=1 Tax=Rhamnella rubrinervis TaxID=2594499 RepID=A0A8K0DK61_9ROSA|nr:hypothetical protein FNV43_RR27342 [Rhamnella rubrinervis]
MAKGVGAEAGSSVPVGEGGDDVEMVNTSAPSSPEPVAYELKDLFSTIFEDEVDRLIHFYKLSHNVTFRTPEKRERPLEEKEGEIASLIGHIVMWFEAYKKLPSMDALRGLFGFCCTRTSGQFYTYMDNLVHWDVLSRGFYLVDAINNISAGKRSASGPASGGSAPKSRRMAGSSTKLATPSRLTKKNHAPPPYPTHEGLSALIFTANSALNSQFRAQVDKDNIHKMSTDAVNASLQGKYKMLEQSLNTEKNERVAVVTRAEAIERGLSQKEGNDNIMLGYNIMRRAVAWKFPGYNMIELDQLATEEAQKGE